MNAQGEGGWKSSCNRFLSRGLLALHISYTLDFSFVQVLVQDFLLKGLLKVMTSLEDVRRCYLQCTYIKKRKDQILFSWLCDILVLLNHLNNITRNYDVFVDCSGIITSITVKHEQHIGIIMAFVYLGGLVFFQDLGDRKN